MVNNQPKFYLPNLETNDIYNGWLYNLFTRKNAPSYCNRALVTIGVKHFASSFGHLVVNIWIFLLQQIS